MADVEIPEFKTCRKCEKTKPTPEFRPKGRLCKDCNAGLSTEWYRQNRPKKAAHLQKWRQNQYGRKRYRITKDEYDALLAKQGGKCAICGTTEPRAHFKRFCVDHCHNNYSLRGLLCHLCNAGIGMFRDRIDRVEAALTYLRGYSPP